MSQTIYNNEINVSNNLSTSQTLHSNSIQFGQNGSSFGSMITGNTAIGSSTEVEKEVTVSIDLTGKTINNIQAIVVKNYTSVVTDTFTVTIKNITSSSIVFKVYRKDANSGWAGNFYLYYLIFFQ